MSINFSSGNTPSQNDAERQLLIKILNVLNGMTSIGGGGSAQVLTYTNDPNSEGVTPAAIGSPALAYSLTKSNPLYTWNTSTQVWQ